MRKRESHPETGDATRAREIEASDNVRGKGDGNWESERERGCERESHPETGDTSATAAPDTSSAQPDAQSRPGITPPSYKRTKNTANIAAEGASNANKRQRPATTGHLLLSALKGTTAVSLDKARVKRACTDKAQDAVPTVPPER